MRAALRSLSFERALAPCIALTVFAFACGSSSVASIDADGRRVRWAMLVVLLGVAAGAAWRAGRPRPPRAALTAGWLGLLALVSTAWSVTPRTTFERAGSFWLLLIAAGLTAISCRRPRDTERVLGGVLAGALLVAVAGAALLAVDRSAALQHGSTGVPTRFRGLGENADTSALLFGVAMPIAVAAVLGARRRSHVVGAVLSLLLLDGSVVGSGSRGPLVAGLACSVLVALLAPARRVHRAAAAGAVLVLLAASIGFATIPKPLARGSKTPPAAQAPGPTPKPGYYNAELNFPLESDIGRPLPGEGGQERARSLTGSSGRLEAWRGALHEVYRRPVVGHGFGTEGAVFVNRYFYFAGGLPENSYIGLLLQLGLVGLLSFLAVFVAWFARGVRAWPRARPDHRLALAASGAAFASGLVMAVVQSYVYSVGDIATPSLWLCGFLLATVAWDA